VKAAYHASAEARVTARASGLSLDSMRTIRHDIIGASAAGVSAAMASRRVGFTGEVVVVGAERHPP
jgi:hypothetical protein